MVGRIRTIKPEFFTSPSTAKASHTARLFYIALWCWADDYGRGETNLTMLAGFAFPEDDQITRKEVPSLCKEVADAFDVEFYTVRDRFYYAIPAWDDHQRTQRKAASRHPGPDDPESAPDLRFSSGQGASECSQGTSAPTQGSSGTGTGEREQGTGEENTCSPAPPSSERVTRFDEFWDAYPRKVGKQKARGKYTAAVKRAEDEQTVIDGAHRLANDPNLPEAKFIPHPTTWLERDGWEDEPLPSRLVNTRDDRIRATTVARHQQLAEYTPAPDPFEVAATRKEIAS